MADEVKYEGTKVKLGGVEYVVPSLSVKQARALWGDILSMDEGITKENLPDKYAAMLKVIHAALTRNYPDVKLEEIEEHVDVANIRDLVRIVCGRSGVGAPQGPQPVAAAPAAA